MKKFVLIPAITLLIGLVVAWLPAQSPARADVSKTYICHLDGGSGKYSEPKPALPAEILAAGHSGHDGDIIPPFPSENYPGKNWDLAGQEIWENECRTPVTPLPVTFTEATCADPNVVFSYTIPQTEGVKYMIDGKEKKDGTYTVAVGDSVTVTAELKKDKDNFFPAGTTTSWTKTFTAPDCEVTPAAVLFTDPNCTTKGTYAIPSSEHVGYKIGDALIPIGTYSSDNGTTVTVNAVTVDSGYTFDAGATTTWAKTFNAPTNCTTSTTTTVVAGASTTTPTTTTTSQVAAVPVGAVDAGVGGTATLATLFGLLSSIGIASYGLALRKQ